jgi:hypothetical protein
MIIENLKLIEMMIILNGIKNLNEIKKKLKNYLKLEILIEL